MSVLSLFIIVLLCVFSVILFLTEPSKSDKLVQERLAALDQKASSGEDDDESLLKETTFSRIRWLDSFLRHRPTAIKLQRKLTEANLNWTVGRFVLLSAISVAAGALVGSYLLADPLAGWVPALFLCVGPYWYVSYKRTARFRKFSLLLPEAVDLISRALRAGHSILAAIELVGIRSEERRVGKECRL